jgi:uncharacterized protein YecT (DUF1311 family)
MRYRSSSFSLLTWFALAICVPPAQAQDRFAALENCAAGSSHVDQRECLERKVKESLSALGSAQKNLMTKLRNVDRGTSDKQRAMAAAKNDAQGFVTYASKHCEAFAALAYGGNSQHDRRLACHVELNAIRAEQLTKVAAAIQ